MRRLLRWTFNTLAAASLLLCLATAGLWVRSYWVLDQFLGQRPEASEFGRKHHLLHYQFVVSSDRGQFSGWFAWSERPLGRPTPPWEFKLDHPPNLFAGLWPDPGFSYGNYAYQTRSWDLPAWSLVSAFAVLPAIFAFRQVRAVRRRRHRSRLGLCPACGYDLRASPERCPECGAVPAKHEYRSTKPETNSKPKEETGKAAAPF